MVEAGWNEIWHSTYPNISAKFITIIRSDGKPYLEREQSGEDILAPPSEVPLRFPTTAIQGTRI